MKKVLFILASVFGILGVPWCGMVWLSGGMRAVPSLDPGDLAVGLPLPCLAALFAAVSLLISRRQQPEAKLSRWLITVLIVSVLTAALTVFTYFDLQQRAH